MATSRSDSAHSEFREVQEGVSNSTQINVSGGNVGITTVTITAEADGYTSATASVRVEVGEFTDSRTAGGLSGRGASARIGERESPEGVRSQFIAATDGLVCRAQ